MNKPAKLLKLNIGSGEQKLDGFVNIDGEAKTKPDVVHDVTAKALPYKNETVDVIFCVHNIEHIKMELWPYVFNEFFRVLKPNGLLYMAYPEFEICAKYFLENKFGKRDFYRACLYGRQLWPGDYHITPVITSELRNILGRYGFGQFKVKSSIDNPQYTDLICYKTKQVDKEHILKQELFPDGQKKKSKGFKRTK